MQHTIELYTDGACIPNPGRGGAGAVLVARNGATVVKTREASLYLGDNVTNNIAEISAVILGLEMLLKPATVTVYSDSQYVVKAGNRDNAIRANREHWIRLFEVITKGQHTVRFEWVKGHEGNHFNERAHNLASQAVWSRTDG